MCLRTNKTRTEGVFLKIRFRCSLESLEHCMTLSAIDHSSFTQIRKTACLQEHYFPSTFLLDYHWHALTLFCKLDYHLRLPPSHFRTAFRQGQLASQNDCHQFVCWPRLKLTILPDTYPRPLFQRPCVKVLFHLRYLTCTTLPFCSIFCISILSATCFKRANYLSI